MFFLRIRIGKFQLKKGTGKYGGVIHQRYASRGRSTMRRRGRAEEDANKGLDLEEAK